MNKKNTLSFFEFVDKYAQGDLFAYEILETLQGWSAYAMHGDTYKIREQLQQQILNRIEKINKK